MTPAEMSDEKRCTCVHIPNEWGRIHEDGCPFHGKEEEYAEFTNPEDARRWLFDEEGGDAEPAEVVERLEKANTYGVAQSSNPEKEGMQFCEITPELRDLAIATIKALEEERRQYVRALEVEGTKTHRYRRALEEIQDRFPHDEWRSNNARELVGIATRALHTEADDSQEREPSRATTRALQTDHEILDNGSRGEG